MSATRRATIGVGIVALLLGLWISTANINYSNQARIWPWESSGLFMLTIWIAVPIAFVAALIVTDLATEFGRLPSWMMSFLAYGIFLMWCVWTSLPANALRRVLGEVIETPAQIQILKIQDSYRDGFLVIGKIRVMPTTIERLTNQIVLSTARQSIPHDYERFFPMPTEGPQDQTYFTRGGWFYLAERESMIYFRFRTPLERPKANKAVHSDT